MYAQCPGCYSIYRMDAGTLSQGGGQVRCAVCELVFNALPTLRDELPPANVEPAIGENVELAFDYAPPEHTAPTEDGGFESGAENAPARRPGKGPWPEAWPGLPHSRLHWFWVTGCALLGVLGLIQLVLWAPPALARYPSLRPVAQALCSVTGCALPRRQDLSRIQLASRDVRAHPSVPGALIVGATLVNEAEFTQAYPLLELRLSNLDGRLVAMRRFSPAGYLPDDVSWRDGMPPGSRVRVSLEVVDPGRGAVSFEFAFRPSQTVGG